MKNVCRQTLRLQIDASAAIYWFYACVATTFLNSIQYCALSLRQSSFVFLNTGINAVIARQMTA